LPSAVGRFVAVLPPRSLSMGGVFGHYGRRLTGVFATRSRDRPNPLGLHPVRVRAIDGRRRLRIGPIEAIDGTPVVDIKPTLR